MKKTLLYGILVLVTCICAFQYITQRPRGATPFIKTVSRIAQVTVEYDVVAIGDGRVLDLSPADEMDGRTLHVKVVKFIESGDFPRHEQLRRLISRDGLIRDGWGNPLVFMSTNSPAYSRINSRLTNLNRPFAVWSMGENQIDELGFGDDVVVTRPAPRSPYEHAQ